MDNKYFDYRVWNGEKMNYVLEDLASAKESDVIMQFSGEISSNGLKIYDEDVLYKSEDFGLPEKAVVKFGRYTDTVSKAESGIGFYVVTENGEQESLEWWSQYQKIGNTFEGMNESC